MRLHKQVISIYLVYLIPFSLCESDCLSEVISTENGCVTYRASSVHPGRPCQLMEKTKPPFTFFIKPESDFNFMTIRVISAITPYHSVQYGSFKLRRGILKQGGGWNEIILRDRTTTNYQGLTWISYFLEINGQQKDISNDPQHTVEATNFQIFIKGGVQWRTGCGRRLNVPFLVPERTTINYLIKGTETITNPTTILPTVVPAATIATPMITETENILEEHIPSYMGPVGSHVTETITSPTTISPTEVPSITISIPMITETDNISLVLTSKSPAITEILNIPIPTIMPSIKIFTTSDPIDTVHTYITNKATRHMKRSTPISEPGIIRSDLDIQTISTILLPTTLEPTRILSSKSTILERPATTKHPITIPTEMPTTLLLTESSSTSIQLTNVSSTLMPTKDMITTVILKTPIPVPISTMPTAMPLTSTLVAVTEEKSTIELNKITLTTTLSLNTDESATTSDVIMLTKEEAKVHPDNITSEPTSPIPSKVYTSKMQHFTPTSLFSAKIDEEYSTSTEYSTTSNTALFISDSETTISTLFIAKTISTVQSENYTSTKSTEGMKSPNITDGLVTSPLSTSMTTVTTLNTTKTRKPRLSNSSSYEVIITDKQSSSIAFGSELPSPLWQMIIYAVLIDIAIVVLALCIFMIIYRCIKKRKSKSLLAEIDHVAFSEYIKKNLKPDSTEADAQSLYGGQIGPGVDSEQEEIDQDVFEDYIKRNLQPNSTGADAASLYGLSSSTEHGTESDLEAQTTQHEYRNMNG